MDFFEPRLNSFTVFLVADFEKNKNFEIFFFNFYEKIENRKIFRGEGVLGEKVLKESSFLWKKETNSRRKKRLPSSS